MPSERHNHYPECPVCALRLTIAQALVYAYRDARREGIDPGASGFVRGILRELDESPMKKRRRVRRSKPRRWQALAKYHPQTRLEVRRGRRSPRQWERFMRGTNTGKVSTWMRYAD